MNLRRPFRNRHDAGKMLARVLAKYAWPPGTMVLALPRGGVTVAFEIAAVLHLPLDVCVVRKLGVPWQPELAMGAIAGGGVAVIHEDVISDLGISQQEIEREVAWEQKELERREKAYREGRPPLNLEGKTVIVVDDGIATGATAEAAVKVLRRQGASRIVVAAAVASPSTVQSLSREADEVVCVLEPESLSSIGEWFDDFEQVSDEEVRSLLARSEEALHAGASSDHQ